ncbi:MAG: hypothetical protein OXU31_09980, partial [Gammaproteobacteria bacterium]|nr:hypothetical protein [Gammaproteobacteria bacterium]
QKTHGAGVESSDWTETSFTLSLLERPSWPAGRAALWGAGATAGEDGEMTLSQGPLSYDADATAFHLGADWERVDGKVVGFSIGRTRGQARAAQTIGGIEIKNLSESSLTGVHPYLLRRLSEKAHGWLALGYSTGEMEVTETQFAASTRRARSDLTLTMAAFGAAWQRPADNICAPWPGVMAAPRTYDLALRVDGVLTRSALESAVFDDGSVLPAAVADTMRLGLETEIGRAWECSVNALRVFVTAGVRNDFRDARKTTSAAADLGGGIHWRRGSVFALRVQGAKQAIGNGDESTWGAEMHWIGQRKEFRIAPFAQLSSGNETPNWQSGIRLHTRRLTLRLGLGLDQDGTDYSQLLRGEVRF